MISDSMKQAFSAYRDIHHAANPSPYQTYKGPPWNWAFFGELPPELSPDVIGTVPASTKDEKALVAAWDGWKQAYAEYEAAGCPVLSESMMIEDEFLAHPLRQKMSNALNAFLILLPDVTA